jgi:hypothetical protein
VNLTSGLRKDDGRWTDLLLMTGLWAVMTWIANPLGDFPLNDDWTYGVSVKALVEEGRMFYLTEWACKTLVAHVFWGALFCLPFGFSYTALRFSQLTADCSEVLRRTICVWNLAHRAERRWCAR